MDMLSKFCAFLINHFLDLCNGENRSAAALIVQIFTAQRNLPRFS